MANEVWLSGKLDGYAPIMMPAAHALVQSIADLKRYTGNLSDEKLKMRLNDSPSVAFHLRHIAGSIDRLLTYARGEELSDAQFDFLKSETAPDLKSNACDLTQKAVDEINHALETLKTIQIESLFEERFVGRQKLPTNVFGLLFHIAEHTARHVGQIITISGIVRTERIN